MDPWWDVKNGSFEPDSSNQSFAMNLRGLRSIFWFHELFEEAPTPY